MGIVPELTIGNSEYILFCSDYSYSSDTFQMDTKTYEFIPWDAVGVGLKDIAVNNFYYYVTEMIASQGGSLTLLILGVFLAVMTLLKAFSYFASSAVMIPLRTGVVRDIRAQVYNKVLHLPLSFSPKNGKAILLPA